MNTNRRWAIVLFAAILIVGAVLGAPFIKRYKADRELSGRLNRLAALIETGVTAAELRAGVVEVKELLRRDERFLERRWKAESELFNREAQEAERLMASDKIGAEIHIDDLESVIAEWEIRLRQKSFW